MARSFERAIHILLNAKSIIFNYHDVSIKQFAYCLAETVPDLSH